MRSLAACAAACLVFASWTVRADDDASDDEAAKDEAAKDEAAKDEDAKDEDAKDEDAKDEGASNVERARAIFVKGAELAKRMRWGDALSRFEASAKLQPHAGTSYNIGICLRALGRYTRARLSFRHALSRHEASGGSELAESTVANIAGYLKEIERVLATLEVKLEPASATITVDGRPLEVLPGAKGKPKLVAGTLKPGPGRAPPAASFDLVVDPGTHLFVLSRKGFDDAVVRKTVLPASRDSLELVLKRLPATLRIRSNEDGAAVSLDGVDVGLAPVTLQRPAGSYHISVRKQGFDGYDHDVKVDPAQQIELMASLQQENVGIYERWWFWGAIGTVVAGAVVITYFATRPDPERPPLDGGGLGWTIRVP